MENTAPYYTYSAYLRKKYNAPAYRIGVDGGFSCPNREGDGSGGCSYCDETGAAAVYHRRQESKIARNGFPDAHNDGDYSDYLSVSCRRGSLGERISSIRDQISHAVEFTVRRYRTEKFLLYFQAYSSSHDTPEVLKTLYDAALDEADFSELIISTRPDCLDDEKIDLIASYRGEGKGTVGDVWVELGLQSASNTALERIRRGHTVEEFETCFHSLRDAGIKVSAHVILGLPGEGYAEIGQTADFLARIHPDAVKIHNLHVPDRTALLHEYRSGEILVPSTSRHISHTIFFLEKIPGDVVIQRLTCDTPAHRLAAPRNFARKGSFFHKLENEMRLTGRSQGTKVSRRITDEK